MPQGILFDKIDTQAMKTVEAMVIVPDDRQVTLRLPDELPPGQHRLVLFIEEAPTMAQNEPTPTRRDDGLLVYDGHVTVPIKPFIDDAREQRIGISASP